MRRSNSSGLPVMRPWIGASKPRLEASLGMSCTSPSVIMTAPATRAGDTSDNADESAPKRAVVASSEGEVPERASTVRTSNSGWRARLCLSAASAASVWEVRSPIVWLWLRSTISATTLFNGSRCSFRTTGLSNANRSAAIASTRITAPRMRVTISASARKIAGTARRAMTVQEKNGAKSTDQVIIGRAFRAAPAHAPGRPCSCRSGRTSRCSRLPGTRIRVARDRSNLSET